MSARACIDPNVRVRGNQTFTGFDDCAGDVVEGQAIEAYEQETGAWTTGIVTDIDFKRKLVYISLNWKTLRRQPHPSSFLSSFAAAVLGNTQEEQAE